VARYGSNHIKLLNRIIENSEVKMVNVHPLLVLSCCAL